MEEKQMSEEELLEQVNLRLYDLFSNKMDHLDEWETFNITDEMANEEIKAYHKKYGKPDMTKLKRE